MLLKKKGEFFMEMTVAFVPGRWNPPHEGHIRLFLWLLSKFDRLIIGIGSCYEVGTSRHPLLAFMREKMIHYSLEAAGVDMYRVNFAHLQDFKSWDEWWQHIISVPGMKNTTHFVTGNEKEIINELKKRDYPTRFLLLNPEKEMPLKARFPYHATQLREAIDRNDYELFMEIASVGTRNLMGLCGGFEGIRAALHDNGTRIIPGRQTVDLIVTCRAGHGDARMVLCGYRSQQKKDFPGILGLPGGGINSHENPMDAAVREFAEETGLCVKIVNRSLEPAHVLVSGIMSEIRFVKLYSTTDKKLGGNQGGSSQVFHVKLDVKAEIFDGLIRSDSDLCDVRFRPVEEVFLRGLAYQQSDMLKSALNL